MEAASRFDVAAKVGEVGRRRRARTAATTLEPPPGRASYVVAGVLARGRLANVDLVDDPHHHRPHRSVGRLENLPRAVAFVEHEHGLAGAGADRVGGDQVIARRLAVGRDLLDDEQALSFVELVLARGVDLAAGASEDHARSSPAMRFTPSTMAMMA